MVMMTNVAEIPSERTESARCVVALDRSNSILCVESSIQFLFSSSFSEMNIGVPGNYWKVSKCGVSDVDGG